MERAPTLGLLRRIWYGLPYLIALWLLILVIVPPFIYTSFFGTAGTLDLSWRWAIYTAVVDHLQFGKQFIFTYGPLGFLDSPVLGLSRRALLLAILLKLIGDTGLCYQAFIACRKLPRTKPTHRTDALNGLIIVATLLMLLELLAQPLSTVIAVFFIIAMTSAVLSNGTNSLLAWVFYGSIMAFDTLDKSSFGLLFLATTFFKLALEILRRVKNTHFNILAPIMGLVSFSFSLLVLWTITGQRIGSMVFFIRGEFQIIIGYAKAMSLQGFTIDIWLALLLFASLGSLTLIDFKIRYTDKQSNIDQSDNYLTTEAIVYLSLFLLFFWKEGVVRQDPVIGGGHFAIIFLAILTVVMFRVLYSPILLKRTAEKLLLIITCAIAIIFSSQFLVGISPLTNLQNIDNLIQVTSSRDSYNQYLSAQKGALATSYSVPSSLTTRIGHSSVVILPYNLTIGPALGLNEVLLPVAQTYLAYTPYLDRLDTEALTALKPRFILLQFADIDGRYPLFTAPHLIDKILTSYRFIDSGGGFALFEAEPMRPLHLVFQVTEPGTDDSWLQVPLCTGSYIDARIAIHQSLIGSIRSLVYRSSELEIILRRGTTIIGPSRFIYSTASDGLDLTTMTMAVSELVPFKMQAATSQVLSFEVSGLTPNHWNADFSKTFKVVFSCYG